MMMDEPRIIYLTKGMQTVVSARDYPWLSKHRWYFNGEDSPYAKRSKTVKGVRTVIYMHRAITSAPEGTVANHRDGDTLNNTRGNLNVCTVRQNGTIYRVAKGRFGLIGVDLRGGVTTPVGGMKHYRSRITFLGERKFLGHFYTKEDAALAYDHASVRLLGIYAPTNYPPENYHCPFIKDVQSLETLPPEEIEDIPW